MKRDHMIEKKQTKLHLLFYGIATILLSITAVNCNGTSPFDGGGSIYTEDDFHKMRDNLGKNFVLMNDITLNPYRDFEPIGGLSPTEAEKSSTPFTGIFEGNGYTINRVRISEKWRSYVGLFGAIGPGGEVRNLKLNLVPGNAKSPSIEGKNFVGALAGSNEGVISNVGVEGGYIKGNNSVGGLVGWIRDGASITTSYSTGTVTGDDQVGGLVGLMELRDITVRIENSYVTGAVTGNNQIGGLVGQMFVHIRNTNEIGTKKIGIKNTYATGTVTGNNQFGGMVGHVASAYAGYIVFDSSYFDTTLTGQLQGGVIRERVRIAPYHTDGNVVYTPHGDLILKTSFPGWSFTHDPADGNEDHWHWSGDGMWPRLAWQQ